MLVVKCTLTGIAWLIAATSSFCLPYYKLVDGKAQRSRLNLCIIDLKFKIIIKITSILCCSGDGPWWTQLWANHPIVSKLGLIVSAVKTSLTIISPLRLSAQTDVYQTCVNSAVSVGKFDLASYRLVETSAWRLAKPGFKWWPLRSRPQRVKQVWQPAIIADKSNY